MKRISTLVISSLTAAFLVGCGGGSSSSGVSTQSVDVTAERGAIWGATVTDSSNPVQTAKQKSATSNVYTFTNTPVYPIKVTGGIIDEDGDASTTDDVYDFSGKTLTSYSTVISPITDYLGDTTSEEGKAKLAKLKEITGATDADLLSKVPSETNGSILALTNSLYGLLNDGDDSNDDFISDYDNSSFKTIFETKVNSIDTTLSLKEISKLLESETMSGLGLSKMTEEEVKAFFDNSSNSISSFSLTTEMISGKLIYVSDEEGTLTAQFHVDGSYSEDWNDTTSGGNSGTCTGTWALSGNTVTVTSLCSDETEQETYKLVFSEAPVTGSVIKLFDLDGESSVTLTEVSDISSDSSGSTSSESSSFTLTSDMISGKHVLISGNGQKSLLSFGNYYEKSGNYNEAGGSFYEIFNDSNSGGENGTCYGDWLFAPDKKNTIQIDYICSDSDFVPNGVVESGYSTQYLTLNEEFKSKSIINFVNGDEQGSLELTYVYTSFVSDKIFTSYDKDNNDTVIAEFAPGGLYTERGNDYSCNGVWMDLGENKIAMTCDDNGTYEIPDGTIDSNSDEIHFKFNSNNPQVGDGLTAIDYAATYSLEIKDITPY